jgi:alcohol dehydrogenase
MLFDSNIHFLTISANPSFSQIREMWEFSRLVQERTIVAVGGGSAIDQAKMIIALSNLGTSPDSPEQFEEFTTGTSLQRGEFIAIPTTAGSGSESTYFATLWDQQTKKKHSISNSSLLPDEVWLIPELLSTLPFEQALVSNLDAYSHAFDSLWNRTRTDKSTRLARKAIELLNKGRIAEPVGSNSGSKLAYQLLGSNFSGRAICMNKTSLSHALSYYLTSAYGVPHGLACGIFVSAILESNAFWSDKLRKELSGIDLQIALHQINAAITLTSKGEKAAITPTSLIKESTTYSRSKNFSLDFSEADIFQVVESGLSKLNG